MKNTIVMIVLGIFIINFLEAQDTIKQTMHEQCDSLLKSQEVKAISMAIVRNGETYILHKGKLGDGTTPNDKTTYEIASMTKTFTGTLFAKAIVSGKVQIDDDIRNYLTLDLRNLEYHGKPLTFRHLLTHTSGLPRMFPHKEGLYDNPNFDILPFEINEMQEGFSQSQFFKSLQKFKLDTIPGHKFSYSNAAANLLGYCLENIYGRPYESLLNEHIFQPLGMKSSKIELTEDEKKHLTKGFSHNGIEMPFYAHKNINAEGGIKSNIEDMVQYMKYHLNVENPIVITSHMELLNGKYGAYENGLFWQIFKEDGKPDKVFQNGGAFGTSCWMTLLPETETGIFIITNVSGPLVHHKLSKSVNTILEKIN